MIHSVITLNATQLIVLSQVSWKWGAPCGRFFGLNECNKIIKRFSIRFYAWLLWRKLPVRISLWSRVNFPIWSHVIFLHFVSWNFRSSDLLDVNNDPSTLQQIMTVGLSSKTFSYYIYSSMLSEFRLRHSTHVATTALDRAWRCICARARQCIELSTSANQNIWNWNRWK